MKVTSSKKGSTCTLTVEGKIDTMTAPELEEAVKSNLSKTSLPLRECTRY